ncbi:hypothetical protein CKO24_14520, partial [Rhodothalassium salexigens DSM 2132]|nr:hypothetical protein [Rhodothalassium salexigens DSM 2132]
MMDQTPAAAAAPKASPGDRVAQLEAALTEALRELTAERDALYDDLGDEAEVARLDGIIDRGRAALSGQPQDQPFAAGRIGAPSTIDEAVALRDALDRRIAAM